MKIKFRATLGTLKRKDWSEPRLTRWLGYIVKDKVYIVEPLPDKIIYKIVPDSKIKIIGVIDLGEMDQTVLLSMDDIDLPTFFPSYPLEKLQSKIEKTINKSVYNEAKSLVLSEYMFMPYFLEGYDEE